MQISCFFKLFNTKNAENDFFNQLLECCTLQMLVEMAFSVQNDFISGLAWVYICFLCKGLCWERENTEVYLLSRKGDRQKDRREKGWNKCCYAEDPNMRGLAPICLDVSACESNVLIRRFSLINRIDLTFVEVISHMLYSCMERCFPPASEASRGAY